MRTLRVIALAILGLYVLVAIATYFFQRSFIYFPQRLAAVPDSIGGAVVVRFRARNGPLVSGLWHPPPRPDGTVALVFHGNAGSIASWSPVVATWARVGCGALLVDPRGYGASEGSPSEVGFHADGEAALMWLAEQGVAASRVIVEGISIGGGIAVPLAAKHTVKGLVLRSAFTSLPDVAWASFPILPFGLLLRDRFDNVTAARGVSCPVLVVHGTSDRLVPVEQAKRLAAAFLRSPTLRLVAGYDHNDLSSWPGLEPTLAEFVTSLR